MRQGMINMDNYEAFFLDYREGNLTEEEKEQLFLFLKAHPGLGEELEQYEDFRLMPGNIRFAGKDRLKKPDDAFETVDDENAEEAMIAHWEREMNAEQEARLEEYLRQHPGRQGDFIQYGKMFLKAPDVSYTGKKRLIRNSRPGLLWLYRSAAAAAVLLLALLLFRQQIFQNPSGGDDLVSAREEPVKVTGKSAEPGPVAGTASPVAAMTGKMMMPEESRRRKSHREKIPSEGKSLKNIPVSGVHEQGKMAYCPVIREYSLPVQELSREVVVEEHYVQGNKPENVLTLAEFAAMKIKENVLEEDTVTTPRLNAREVALLGIKGINRLTGLNLQVKKKEIPAERKEYFALTSRFFTYTRVRPVEKEKK